MRSTAPYLESSVLVRDDLRKSSSVRHGDGIREVLRPNNPALRLRVPAVVWAAIVVSARGADPVASPDAPV
jgi:hypothetical protein